MMIAPVGRWWLAYSDRDREGEVWPVEVIEPSIWPGYWRVLPVHPAPDAGEVRHEPTLRIYDSAFNHPGDTA